MPADTNFDTYCEEDNAPTLEDVDLVTTGPEDAKAQAGVIRAAAIAEIIARHVQLAKDRGGRVYFYGRGCYHPGGEDIIAFFYKRILKHWGKLGDWKGSQLTDIIRYLTIDAPRMWDRPPLNRINFINGIYDLDNEDLMPSTPLWLSTIQIPVRHDEDAVSEHWDKFLEDIFPEGKELLLQLIGWLMVPHTRLQKAVLLLGEGSNGKGTFLRAISNLLGFSNISSASLHQLELDRFSRATLVGKLVNIFGDLPTAKIKDLNLFKSLVGEDTLLIEYKGKDAFSYKPFARLIFSANQVPQSNDDTEGFKRRWLIIPFTRTFSVTSKGGEIETLLSTHSEQSGIMNRILPYIPKVVAHGFNISEEIAGIIDNYTPTPNNVKEWLDFWVEPCEEGLIPTSDLYRVYVETLKGLPGGESYTISGFVRFIKNNYPAVEASQQGWVNGKNVKCFKGIQLRKGKVL